MEPPSPIQALGGNPFLSRFINRTGSLRRFRALIEERADENRKITVVLQAAGRKRIHAIQAHYKRKWFYL